MKQKIKDTLGIETHLGKTLCEIIDIHRELGFTNEEIKPIIINVLEGQIELMKNPHGKTEYVDSFGTHLKPESIN